VTHAAFPPRPLPTGMLPCRAVIFDLDDTLIDSAGVLVPAGHRQAAVAMVAAGLKASVEDVVRARMELFAQDPRADLEARVLARFGATDPAIALAGKVAYHKPLVPSEGLALPGAHAMLRRLMRDYPLFLVTRGDTAAQADKARKAKLVGSFDQIVYVPLASDKRAAFTALLGRMGLAGGECVAIGDRPDAEIAAANALGMWTVRVHRGEFAALVPRTADEVPHWTVTDVREVQPLLLAHFAPSPERRVVREPASPAATEGSGA